ncbi:MAG: ABC transporter substrate-binding protein [Chloroflexi bacterium]|nr:ABC transporter substrate-binding protein [Chloroflexota bacterium]
MVYRITLFSLIISLFAAWGCTATTGPATPPQKQTPSKVESPATAGWEAEWQQVLAAARKEGTVMLYGPPIPAARQGFIETFQRSYPGITLDYLPLGGAQTSPKIRAERAAGLYLADVHVGGTTTILTQLREFAQPLRPLLILPEVKDEKAWLDGKLYFTDNAGEINLGFTIRANSNIAFNTDLVKPGDITSFWDLTKPKWTGQSVMADPRIAGAGLAMATFWYMHKDLGPPFIEAFAKNKPVLTRDLRLMTEWVGRGKNAIGVATDTALVFEFRKAGAPLAPADIMKEGTFSTSAFGSVIAMNKPPHPNAARVFINWLLSKEGQTVWTRTSGFASRRLDVPTDHLSEEMKIVPGRDYSPGDNEPVVMSKDDIIPHLVRIFAGF